MDTIGKLEEIFRHFPGIGPRQARRFVYYLLTLPDSELKSMTDLVGQLKQGIVVCQGCQRFFPIGNKVPTPLCSICSDQNRETNMLMIVSRDIDLQAVEKSRAYGGLYFVLGGSVPILEDRPDQKIRQKEMMDRVTDLISKNNLKEVILATSVNPEGEHTATYVNSLLKPLAEQHKFSITTLGRGLSTGTELEYSDSETLRGALENRR